MSQNGRSPSGTGEWDVAQQQTFRQQALEAWHDYQRTGLHLRAEEVDAWLAELERGNDMPQPECHT